MSESVCVGNDCGKGIVHIWKIPNKNERLSGGDKATSVNYVSPKTGGGRKHRALLYD